MWTQEECLGFPCGLVKFLQVAGALLTALAALKSH